MTHTGNYMRLAADSPARRAPLNGQELRLLREDAGLSRPALAARIDYSFHTISAWERGLRRIPAAQVTRILDAIDAAHSERAGWRSQVTARLQRSA
jgi:DNA-binding transcriptional regulator YiaG